MTGKKENLVQFSERLKSLVPTGSGRDFAKKAGIGYSTVHNYLQAVSSPTLENLVLLAKAANVSVEWLATGKGFAKLVNVAPNNRVLEVPFINIENCLFLDLSIFIDFQTKAKELAALRVDTDVMHPTFSPGSVLLIDQSQKQLREGKVVVLHKEGNYLYKRIQVVSEGYCLGSDNSKYTAMFVNEESLSSFEVLGEVLAVLSHL